MKIETENELAAFIAGVNLGKDLGFVEEHALADRVVFGNFECSSVGIKPGQELEPLTYDNMRDHWAVLGALHDAKERAANLWENWRDNDAVN
tara:strand:- start:510 stop:785 length:276 start_codon:yes stop_codon:yes gene_type:complete